MTDRIVQLRKTYKKYLKPLKVLGFLLHLKKYECILFSRLNIRDEKIQIQTNKDLTALTDKLTLKN